MTFIIATHNPKKCAELSRVLRPLGIEAATDRDCGLELPEVEETGATFADNAYLKAASACKASGLPAIADDSGLMVDALDGAPGVYSARYAGEDGTPADCNRKLLDALRDVPQAKRGAHFVSSICCVFPNGDTVTAEGTVSGSIAFAPDGDGGFGYDPLFLYEGRSFAAMSAEEKDAVSHRGQALRRFAVALENYLKGDNHA